MKWPPQWRFSPANWRLTTGAALLVDGGQLASKFGTWSEDHADFVGDRWVLKSK